MPLPDMLGALRERDFRLLFLARTTSLVGDFMAPVAIAFAVLDLTGSATDLGLVMAARTIPLVVFVLAGGVWADRLPRQRLMLSSDIVCAASQGFLAALLLTGAAAIWQLVVLQAVLGTSLAFFRPASTGLTPQTVSPERLQQANGLIFLSLSLCSVVGPAIGGVLVAGVGPGYAIALDAATFAASAAFLLRLRIPGRVGGGGRESFLAELAGGWVEVRTRSWLWISILNFALFQLVVLATFFVLGPLVAKQSLGGASAWGLIVTAWGIGSVLGGLLALRYRPQRPLFVSYLAIVGIAPAMVLLGFATPALACAVASVPGGFSLGFAGTVWETALQENVPERALSRVAAYDWMGSTVLRPVGYGIVGPIAQAIGVRETLVGAAAILVVLQLATLLVPSVRNLQGREPAPLPEPA